MFLFAPVAVIGSFGIFSLCDRLAGENEHLGNLYCILAIVIVSFLLTCIIGIVGGYWKNCPVHDKNQKIEMHTNEVQSEKAQEILPPEAKSWVL